MSLIVECSESEHGGGSEEKKHRVQKDESANAQVRGIYKYGQLVVL
jgi:hypothetical protein